jgi:predicted permease
MLKNYFKTGIRNLLRNKGYSFLNIFGLAIGIACAGLIFLWVEDEITFDHLHAKKDRLYMVEVNIHIGGNHFTMGSTPRPLGPVITAEIPGIVRTAHFSADDSHSLFTVGDKSLYATGRYTDSSLFNMFTFHFVEGNPKNPFPQPHSLVITESAAKKFFGRSVSIVGRLMKVDNNHNFVVSGVVQDMPENSTIQFEWLAPFNVTYEKADGSYDFSDKDRWDSYGPLTYVELDKNANLSAVNDEIKNLIQKKSPGEKTDIFLFSMNSWRLYNEFANGKPTGSGRISQVRMLSAIAWIILIIACINFMNLVTANGQKRSKEVGIRKVLGAQRKKLVSQFMGEALSISVLATIAAIVIIFISLPAFNGLMHKNLVIDPIRPSHILFLILTAGICGFIAGSYPSLYLSSFNPAFVLKGTKIKTGNASLIRTGLVVVQFVVSVIFIISTIIVYLQIQHIKNRDLGFNKNNLIEINPAHDLSNIFPLIKQDLMRTRLIENVAIADHPTLYGGDSDNSFKWGGKSPDNQVSISHRNITPEYVSTSGMKIIEGRDFRVSDPSESSNVIINRSMEKMMGTESAVGRIIQSSRGNLNNAFANMTIIGVVNDYVYGDVYGTPGPAIFFCKPPEYATYIYIRAKPQSDLVKTIATIEAVMKKNNPEFPLEYKFVDDQFNQMFQNETQTSEVSSVFASLAIIISCLGLFGLAAFTAEQRNREIGIRKVLGASASGIAALLSKDFLKLVLIACLISFPVAWWIMHSWLQNYQYRITISWWIFIAAGMIALMIALFTISFQAIKAAVANPIKSLRTE